MKARDVKSAPQVLLTCLHLAYKDVAIQDSPLISLECSCTHCERKALKPRNLSSPIANEFKYCTRCASKTALNSRSSL